jgi:CMP-N-acetylneuraminic acid synthetase
MIDGKKVLAITLARGGSKGIYKKNIVNLAGKPLIQYTIDEIRKSAYIDHYYISTEDDDIRKVCSTLGVSVIKRPSEFASDTATSSSALIHAVQIAGGGGVEYDYVVEVMVTNPLKTAVDIDGCIEKLHETGAMSVVSVVQLFDHHPARIKYIDNDVLCDFYPEILESRRQDLSPPAYIRNGSIYAMKTEFLLKKLARYDKNSRPYIMPQDRTINIDELMDLYVADAIINNKFIRN